MSAMEKSIIFSLFIGFIFCIYGCGKSFDNAAAELDLAFDNPADSNRPTPSFKTDILPILTQRCAFRDAMLLMDQKMLISGLTRHCKRG